MGGIQFLDSTLNVSEPLTNQFNSGSLFTQFMVFELIPQRAFLFGIIFFSFIMGLLLKKIRTSKVETIIEQKRGWHYFLIAALLGLSPLLHLHTFIASGAFLLFLFLFTSDRKQKIFTFKLGATTAFVAMVFIYFLILRGEKNHQGTWDIWFPGWAQNPKTKLTVANEMNPFVFWIYNTGIFLPLVAIGLYLKRKEKIFYFLAATGLCLFTVALLFNIQPYFYDNLKLFTYSFLFLSPFAALTLEHIFETKHLKLLALILLAFQCTSGFLDLQFLAHQKQSAVFFTREEQALALRFKKIRHSANDLVLIAPKHNHWVPCLSGNPVVMGYPGWLWSWGINYASREQEVQKILAGDPEAIRLLHSLQIHYIIVNQNESNGVKAINFAFLESNTKLILRESNWSIFEVNL